MIGGNGVQQPALTGKNLQDVYNLSGAVSEIMKLVSYGIYKQKDVEVRKETACYFLESGTGSFKIYLPRTKGLEGRQFLFYKNDGVGSFTFISEYNEANFSYSLTNINSFARIIALEGKWRLLDYDTADIESRLTTAENDINTAEGNISSLDSRLTTAENDINTAEGNISSLDGRVTSLEVLDDYVYVGDDNNHLSYTHGVWLQSSIYIDIPVGTWEVTFSCRVNAYASSGNFNYCFVACCLRNSSPSAGGDFFGQYSPCGISGGMNEFECYGSRTFLATYTSTTRLYLWYVATMYGGSGHRSGIAGAGVPTRILARRIS